MKDEHLFINYASQKAMKWYLQSAERQKKMSPIGYQANSFFKN